jgi:hypothetical protein
MYRLTSFSWRKKDDAGRLGLPPLKYACDSVDQHGSGWCGSCYIIAVVQAIEDSVHISNRGKRIRICLQSTMNHFQSWNEHDTWNVCHGGSALQVLKCFKQGSCSLISKRAAFVGFTQKTNHCYSSNIPFRVSSFDRIEESRVKHELLTRGPVMLEISYLTCRDLDKNGVSTDIMEHPRNHCVNVVGWTVVNGTECWIIRNSWGTKRMPSRIPVDYTTCVDVDRNVCSTEWKEWRGMPSDPGFFLLPTSHPGLHSLPPPWITFSIHRTN